MSDEIVVNVEPPSPDVEVIIEPPLPDVQVVLSEVGLVGPQGPEGPVGPVGPEGPQGTAVVVGGVSEEMLDNHILSETPHPVYDDGPSFLLLYNNAKV